MLVNVFLTPVLRGLQKIKKRLRKLEQEIEDEL
jgi:hypothetical protein